MELSEIKIPTEYRFVEQTARIYCFVRIIPVLMSNGQDDPTDIPFINFSDSNYALGENSLYFFL